MEFGDIIYFILLLFFMILGFFNDSRKKKNLEKRADEKRGVPSLEDRVDTIFQTIEREKGRKRETTTPPAIAEGSSGVDVHRTFQSSLDLVTDFKKQSSLQNSIFVYDADSSFAQEIDDTDYYGDEAQARERGSTLHPLVSDLIGEDGIDELKKGLVYGEIIQRKY